MTRRFAVLIGLMLAPAVAEARNLTSADGPGGTYDLIRRNYTTELPDCGHMVDHITEAFDDELKKNVFVFHAHVNQDDDRCGATDRQRTEIRARAADIIANNGETVYYRWKFKLASGFQGSPSFTHIMQIKSDQAAPVMTLTPRTSTLAIDGRIGARGATDLAKFIGVWVVAEMKVVYGNSGSVALTIRKISDGSMLFNYSGGADTWDDGASAHDFKAGIYRSLNNRGMLRDEQVRFADFCASKMSAAECEDGAAPPPPPPSDGGAAPDMGGGDAGGTGGSGGAGGAGGNGGGVRQWRRGRKRGLFGRQRRVRRVGDQRQRRLVQRHRRLQQHRRLRQRRQHGLRGLWHAAAAAGFVVRHRRLGRVRTGARGLQLQRR